MWGAEASLAHTCITVSAHFLNTDIRLIIPLILPQPLFLCLIVDTSHLLLHSKVVKASELHTQQIRFSVSSEYSGENLLLLVGCLFILSTYSTSDPAVASIPGRSLQFLPQWTLMRRNWAAPQWQLCPLSALCVLVMGLVLLLKKNLVLVLVWFLLSWGFALLWHCI